MCLKKCRERIKEILAGHHNADDQSIFRDLVTSTTIHEHTHAIINEGILRDSGQQYMSDPHGKKLPAL